MQGPLFVVFAGFLAWVFEVLLSGAFSETFNVNTWTEDMRDRILEADDEI